MISSLTSRFEFFNRRALFLSAHKAAIYQWDKGGLGSSYLFDVNEQGLEHFERYLKETNKCPTYILVDFFEEEFRRDTIPHVFGPDRASIIERKQARLFRETPYCHYEIQGREEDGRRDDKILLTAITNPALVEPWIELLDKHQVPLAGIESLSLFTKTILKLIPEPSDHMLIVSLQSVSGLRQTFFEGNEFRISRLVKMPRYGTEPYAPYIATEVEKIRRYLSSLRLTSVDEPLDIYFLTSGELTQELKDQHTNSAETKYHVLDLNELNEAAGSNTKIKTPFSDQFFIEQVLKKRPSNRYAGKADTRYFAMRQMRYSMLAASILLVVAGVIWGGMNFLSGLTHKQNSIAAQKKAEFYTTRYQIARERLPQTPVEPAQLQSAVEIIETLNEYKTNPMGMVRLISFGLGRYQDIRIDNIDWFLNTDPNAEFGKQDAPKSKKRKTAKDNKANIEGEDYKIYQIASINAHLQPFSGNYREAIATVNEFAETIRAQKAVYDVSIISLPLDISSEVNMSGNAKVEEKEANFSLKIVLGVVNEA